MKRDNFNKILLNIDTTYYQTLVKKNKKSNIIFPFYMVIAGIVIYQLLFSHNYTYFGASFTINDSTVMDTFSVIAVFSVIALAFGCLFMKPKSINKLLYSLSFIQIFLFVANFLLQRLIMSDILFLPTVAITGLYLGFLVSSLIYLAFYALDSKQRINSFALIVVFISIFSIVRMFVSNVSNIFVSFVLPLVCLLILVYTMPFLGKSYFSNFTVNNEKNPISPLFVWVILIILVLFNEMIFLSMRDSFVLENWGAKSSNLVFGFFIAIFLCRIIYSITSYSNYGYIFLWISLAIITYQLCLYNYFMNEEIFKTLIPISMGMTTGAGLIGVFMILGNILYDKASLSYVRWSGTIAAVIIAVYLSTNHIFLQIPALNMLVLGQIVAFVLLFLWIIFILVIFFNRHNTQIEAINNDLSDENEAIIIDTQYPNPYELLTNKEIIVFEQLLLGNTLRQIAGELHMKYDTVNFHYKNIYRKLDVNSRIELIVRYGKK